RAAWARRVASIDDDPDAPRPADIAAAVLAWAVPCSTLEALRAAIAARRAALVELCRDDALLTFATAHATKGLEFDHVAVIGMERGRFPSARSLADAVEPDRALEEERRLAYVAWTRARRSLTLVYDPATPSSFLLEAFSPDELGVEEDALAG
ncbi:MAG: ATP-dependent helicase UvrD/PcrA, partial [Chloroflexota bacterium]|nr:ATP-dependent helicase UvrD/PcrA [Chloroflexota bacterium]